MRSKSEHGISITSGLASDLEKEHALHTSRLTTAIASAKVGHALAYQAAVRTTRAPECRKALIIGVTTEYNPKRAEGGPADGQVIPLSLGFNAQMGAGLF